MLSLGAGPAHGVEQRRHAVVIGVFGEGAFLRRLANCLALGGRQGEDGAGRSADLVEIVVEKNFAVLGEQLGDFPFVIDQLHGAAGRGLEQPGIDAVVEFAVPGVQVEDDIGAVEHRGHRLRREKSFAQMPPERRVAGQFLAPGAEDPQIEGVMQLEHQLLAQRAPVAGKADLAAVFRKRRDAAVEITLAGGRQKVGLRNAGCLIVGHRTGRIGEEEIVVAALLCRALELEGIVDPPAGCRDILLSEVFERRYGNVETEKRDEDIRLDGIDQLPDAPVDAGLFLVAVTGKFFADLVVPLAAEIDDADLVSQILQGFGAIGAHRNGLQMAGNGKYDFHDFFQ